MKKYINRNTILLSVIALLLNFTVSHAQDGRVAIESEFTIKKSGEASLAKEGKKDITITIDKSKLTKPKFVIFWIKDSNGEVVKSVVLDEEKLLNNLNEIKDRVEVNKKNFAFKLQGLSPGEYKIHVRIIMNEDLMYVIDKTETVS